MRPGAAYAVYLHVNDDQGRVVGAQVSIKGPSIGFGALHGVLTALLLPFSQL